MDSPYLQTALTALIGLIVASLYKQALAYFKSGKEWRKETTKRVDAISESLVCVMRGDLIHKAHRYVDDRGYATMEEKESWHEEWEQYQKVCPKNGFIDAIAEQVMNLPEHLEDS